MAKITPVGSNVGFWRENSNISYLKVNVARFARDVVKLIFLGCFFKLCATAAVSLSLVGHS